MSEEDFEVQTKRLSDAVRKETDALVDELRKLHGVDTLAGITKEYNKSVADVLHADHRQQKTSSRRQLLEDAANTIDGDRNDTYGGPEESFQCIGELWTSYIASRFSTVLEFAPHDVAAMMALLKIARIAATGGAHRDSWLDLAGYAACGAEVSDCE